jgi:hypothetical protein
MQCQVAADGSGRDGDAEIEGDQALVSPKGNRFPNEEAAIKLPPSQVRVCTAEESAYGWADLLVVNCLNVSDTYLSWPDVNDCAHGDGVCDQGATDGQPSTVAMAKEDQVAVDGSERDGVGERNNDQALVSPKGSCFLNEEHVIKFPPLLVSFCTNEPTYGLAKYIGCSCSF